jgi:hypothetical protein
MSPWTIHEAVIRLIKKVSNFIKLMKRHFPPVALCVLGFAATTSLVFVRPTVAQDRAAQLLLKQEEQLNKGNVVSAVLPRGGGLFLDTIRAAGATRGADWARGDIQVASLDDTRLIWQTIPSWLHEKEEASLQSYQGVLGEFLTKDVEIKDDLATLTGDYSHDAVLAAYLGAYQGAPEPIREGRKTAATALLAEKETKVQLGVWPSLTFYDATGTYLGSTTYPEAKPTFKADRIDPKDIATINWYKAPMRIDPQVELTPADAARAITLTTREGVRTIAALSQELSAQGMKIEPVDEEIGNISLLFIQRNNWTAGELLKSVAAVGGFEVQKMPDGYRWSRSPAHADVGGQIYTLALARHEQQETLKTVFQIYARNGNQLDLPFEPKFFRSGAPIPVENLTPAVRAKVLAPLDEATRREVRQVWFVLNVTLGLRGSTRGNTVGFALAPFPVEYNLNPPLGWKGFDKAEFQELHRAKITPFPS